MRQFDERNAIEGRAQTFGGTATAIAQNRVAIARSTDTDIAEAAEVILPEETETVAPTIITVATTPPTRTPLDEPTIATLTHTPVLTATTMPTETHTPEPTLTDTVEPTNTPEPTVTNTPVPPTETPEPTDTDEPTATVEPTATDTAVPSATLTETDLPPTETPEPTTQEANADDRSVEIAQVFATNTPRPVVFATNTLVNESIEDVTSTSLPTEVPIEVTETPLPTMASTQEESTQVPTEQSTVAPSMPSVTPLPPSLTPSPLPTIVPTEVVPTLVVTQPLPTPLLPQDAGEGRIDNGTAVPTIVPLVPREGRSLLNIMLLGVEDELAGDSFPRTDTMIVVSINRDENTVSMLSLPRDLFVYIPTTQGEMQRLNVAYGLGEVNGYDGGGFGLLRQTIFYNFGINVHYYAEVNFSGFRELIDALGGVEIAVDCAYEDFPLIGAEVPDGAEASGDEGLQRLDIGVYQMNGAQALWYARTRRNASDFDRGRRQQQLLRAIWQQSVNQLSLTNAPQLWDQLNSIVETDMGLDEFIGLIPIALNLDVNRLRSYTLIPTYHTRSWAAPDGANVQLPIYETLRPLVEDFYRPPTNSAILIEGATVGVYNGTENENWDRVAAERLGYEGFRAVPLGRIDAAEGGQSSLIDYTGQQKGSSLGEIVEVLNVNLGNVEINPDPSREYDFVVTLGEDYNSCNIDGVLDPDELN